MGWASWPSVNNSLIALVGPLSWTEFAWSQSITSASLLAEDTWNGSFIDVAMLGLATLAFLATGRREGRIAAVVTGVLAVDLVSIVAGAPSGMSVAIGAVLAAAVIVFTQLRAIKVADKFVLFSFGTLIALQAIGWAFASEVTTLGVFAFTTVVAASMAVFVKRTVFVSSVVGTLFGLGYVAAQGIAIGAEASQIGLALVIAGELIAVGLVSFKNERLVLSALIAGTYALVGFVLTAESTALLAGAFAATAIASLAFAAADKRTTSFATAASAVFAMPYVGLQAYLLGLDTAQIAFAILVAGEVVGVALLATKSKVLIAPALIVLGFAGAGLMVTIEDTTLLTIAVAGSAVASLAIALVDKRTLQYATTACAAFGMTYVGLQAHLVGCDAAQIGLTLVVIGELIGVALVSTKRNTLLPAALVTFVFAAAGLVVSSGDTTLLTIAVGCTAVMALATAFFEKRIFVYAITAACVAAKTYVGLQASVLGFDATQIGLTLVVVGEVMAVALVSTKHKNLLPSALSALLFAAGGLYASVDDTMLLTIGIACSMVASLAIAVIERRVFVYAATVGAMFAMVYVGLQAYLLDLEEAQIGLALVTVGEVIGVALVASKRVSLLPSAFVTLSVAAVGLLVTTNDSRILDIALAATALTSFAIAFLDKRAFTIALALGAVFGMTYAGLQASLAGLNNAQAAVTLVVLGEVLAVMLVNLSQRRFMPTIGVLVLFAAAATVVTAVDSTMFSIALAAGAAATASVGALLRKSSFGWLSAAFVTVLIWTQLVATGVETVEAYTLPLAALALYAGLLAWRREVHGPSIQVFGAGIALLFAPTLMQMIDGSSPIRSFILLIAGTVSILIGARARVKAPLIAGAAVVIISALVEVGPYFHLLPRWVVIGTAGVILVSVGATWEARRRDMLQAKAKYEEFV